MASEFELIFDEFSSELDALAEMAVARREPARSSLTARARIAASNGATLLLAATFEEYVRQQVRAAYEAKANRAKSIEDFPAKIASTVWRRSLESLARLPFEEVEADVRSTDERLAAIVAFCLRKDIKSDVGSALAHNDNNMRTAQLNALFNQIGLQNMCGLCCADRDLLDHIGGESPGKGSTILEGRVDDFFRRRNAVAHAIKLGSSSGPQELSQDIELFRRFGRAIAVAIEKAI